MIDSTQTVFLVLHFVLVFYITYTAYYHKS